MRVLIVLLAGLLAGCAGIQNRKPDDLSVTRVVLYQNGIGYFERQGKVRGQQIKLRIMPQQITDVLKSLTVVDLGSGRAINVALPVEKTRIRRLAALPPQVRRGGGIMAIAQAFRGAMARVRAKGGSGTGRIVGIEELGDGGPRLTLLRDDGALQVFALKDVRALQIRDRTLEVGLRKALDVSLDSGAWKPVELTVHLIGPTPHDLLMSYVVDMPTWKPAYRVVLTSGKTEGLLQGWAVVDNVSGEDWDKVRLSLTAGTPLTFKYDLYSPRYVRRPDLSPRQEAMAVAPPPPTSGAAPEEAKEEEADYSPVLSSKYKKKSRRPSRRSFRGKAGKRGWGSPAASVSERMVAPDKPPPPPRMTSQLLEKSFRALVSGSRVGSLYRYDIEEPVTIKDRQSALVSLLDKKVPAEDILLFRMETNSTNPYRAVRLTNSTGYILESGPIAIYRDGDFVGEAVGGQVEAKTSTFIPYSVDGRVLVTLQDRIKDEGASLLKIYNGKIFCEVKRVSVHKYSIHNRSGDKHTLYVQRRHRTGWKLTQPNKGALLEKDYYFVPIPVAAKGKTDFEVREETPVRRWVGLYSSMARQAIGLYLKDPSSDAKISASLKAALDLQDQIAKLDRAHSRLSRTKRTYSDRQGQVRNNLKLLGKSLRNADLARKLTKTLLELEKQLNKVTRELVETDIKRSELRDRLTVLMSTITLDVKKSS